MKKSRGGRAGHCDGVSDESVKKVSKEDSSEPVNLEMKDLPSFSDEPIPKKIPESESRREKAILVKARENRETAAGQEQGDQENLTEQNVDACGDNMQQGGLLIITPDSGVPESDGNELNDGKSSQDAAEAMRHHDMIARDSSSDAASTSSNKASSKIKSRNPSTSKGMTFPQAVEQVRACMKMGNVRSSSAGGSQILQAPSSVPAAVIESDNNDQITEPGNPEMQEDEIEEAAAPVQGMDEEVQGTNGILQRRHSTGSASRINRAHLLAMIRRLQKRRFRPPTQSTAVKYIQYFMAFLYYCGMSPIQPASAKNLPKWLTWIQYGFFWIFKATSILQSLGQLKEVWIKFRADENMLNFVTLGFFFMNSFIRIYHVKFFATSATSASALLQRIDKVNSRGKPIKGGWARWTGIIIGTFAILLSGLGTLFADDPLQEWSFKDAMLTRSFQLGHYLFRWTSQNYKNESIRLYEEYGEDLNSRAKWFAGIGSWLNFFGTLHSCVILDLWPIIAIQIFILQWHFTTAMDRTKKLNTNGRCPLSIHWRYYMELREACDETHGLFGKLIKLIHIQNILLYSYFLLQLLKKDPVTISLVINFVSVVKASLTYYIVQISADKNEKYEECVIQCSGRRPTIEMGGIEMSVSVLLKDMKKHPIGVGRGEFFVNEAFLLKFAATIGSIFMLLSDESGEKCSCP